MRTVQGLSLDPGVVGAPNNKWPRRTLAERFWLHAEKSEGCWLWTGSKNPRGYGTFGIGNKKTALAHRVSWVMANRPLAAGELILHSAACVSRACVRPDHLRVGNQAENMADARASGTLFGKRVARGEEAGQAKLTGAQVLEVVRRYRSGERARTVAADFGITRDHVTRLSRGEEWRHLFASDALVSQAAALTGGGR